MKGHATLYEEWNTSGTTRARDNFPRFIPEVFSGFDYIELMIIFISHYIQKLTKCQPKITILLQKLMSYKQHSPTCFSCCDDNRGRKKVNMNGKRSKPAYASFTYDTSVKQTEHVPWKQNDNRNKWKKTTSFLVYKSKVSFMQIPMWNYFSLAWTIVE